LRLATESIESAVKDTLFSLAFMRLFAFTDLHSIWRFHFLDLCAAWFVFLRCGIHLSRAAPGTKKSQPMRLAPSVSVSPAVGPSRSRTASGRSARVVLSASGARKGGGKRRDGGRDGRQTDGGDDEVWWRDPDTGGASGVARRSLLAAAAQLAFAAVAVKSQRLYDVWRGAGWGESSWRGGDIDGADSQTLRDRWSAEEAGWRTRWRT
jgi:hypothetical protein